MKILKKEAEEYIKVAEEVLRICKDQKLSRERSYALLNKKKLAFGFCYFCEKTFDKKFSKREYNKIYKYINNGVYWFNTPRLEYYDGKEKKEMLKSVQLRIDLLKKHFI